ncbi:hypothetical protein L873DRAFT_1788509 [Choiromyces venosus 120613-1]|uniref:Uncharacterized protein n=1 Tax=Choiromyces venosus 120613-1 TaxID=1336337 RepID=A0A3N4JWK5_9PEZI|nr:hypothetical protein L873DRAFT_1788509 [Choiromyces venosus 120613-1]
MEQKELYKKIVQQAQQNAALNGIALNEKTEKLKLQHNFNVHEALVFQATIEGKIQGSHQTQKGLNILSRQPAFKTILVSEVKVWHLIPKQVTDCILTLYHTVPKYAHGNDSTITLRASDYAPNEFAALVVFLKLQSTWPDALAWRQEAGEDALGGVPEDDMEGTMGVDMKGGTEGDK